MNKQLEKIGIIIILLLLILGGLQIIFFGSLETTSASSSIYAFNGLERIIGLLPIIFGTGGIYLIVTGKSNLD